MNRSLLGTPTWTFHGTGATGKARKGWKKLLAGRKSIQSWDKAARLLSELSTPELINRRIAVGKHLEEVQAYLVLMDQAIEQHITNHHVDCRCLECNSRPEKET